MIVEEKLSEIQAKNFLMIKCMMLNSEQIGNYIQNGWRGDPDKVGERNVCND